MLSKSSSAIKIPLPNPFETGSWGATGLIDGSRVGISYAELESASGWHQVFQGFKPGEVPAYQS